MKKFFSLLCAVAIVMSASAAPLHKVASQRMLSNQPVKVEKVAKPAKAQKLVADIPFASGTYYTAGGSFYVYSSSYGGFADATSYMPSIDVTVSGNQVTIVGLAYWFEEGAVTGTLANNVITIPSGQLVGTDDYGDEYLVGSNDAQTVSDIVFEYDPAAGTLTAATAYIIESESPTSTAAFSYWADAVFSVTEPEQPEAIVIPAGLSTSLYKFEGHDSYLDSLVVKYTYVGFDADTVYIQGMSDYIADAWIKGVKNAAGAYEFAAAYLGVLESLLGDYEIYSAATSMTYDATLDKFTCAEFTTTASGYAADEYDNITLTKFNEVAATPADPSFVKFAFADVTYPYVQYNIPLVGTANEDLSPEKLSYEFFVQKGNESSPLVLTTDLYQELDQDMTEIPYTFSDDYDIYNTHIYLNQSEAEVRTWDKLGLQVIYRGGSEEHKSNIVWFDVKAYWESQGIENVVLTEKAQKVVVDGAVYVIRDNKMFNVLGNQVR